MYYRPNLPYPFSNFAGCAPAKEQPACGEKPKVHPIITEPAPYKEPYKECKETPVCKEPQRRDSPVCREPQSRDSPICKDIPEGRAAKICAEPAPCKKTPSCIDPCAEVQPCKPPVTENCCVKEKQGSTLAAQNSCADSCGGSNQISFILVLLFLFGMMKSN